MLDANLEWTEQLGEAYLADPAAVMDAVQWLRRRAQSPGRLVTAQEMVGAEQEATSVEQPMTIEASSPEIVYVPICDPSFAYGPWPYPDYPPFFPAFAGATIGGCSWISGPIVAPFWGWVVLNFRTRHIEIDRKQLALFDRERDRERDRDRALIEEWRHDPGHRGNVPYRNSAVSALFGRGIPAANVSPGLGGRWTGPPRQEGPLPVSLPQEWRRPAIEDARPSLDGGPEGGRSPTPGVQPRFVGAQPTLEGVDPSGSGTPAGQALNRDAETRMLVERGLVGRVPPAALAPALGGLRGSGSFGGARSIQSVGGRGPFQPLVGGGGQPFGGRGRQMPSGAMGAGGGRGGS